ncbi:hypothetical protein [Thiohalophilus sp.]|uniref:hypothetical protein n=1 Tax=Thiohalophilus sp. TaxID=3028392 RepID=UPI002ACEFD17|nr:hypothetical protein [Thiohalophilus sp.]MDZ7804707.1 hypothetical protein [Thiohalophilus sp.]
MSNVHYISPEPDRRAYEAMKNITNLKRYRNERERMDHMKDRLSQAVMREYAEQPVVPVIVFAINAGHAVLESGGDFNDALAAARQYAETHRHG